MHCLTEVASPLALLSPHIRVRMELKLTPSAGSNHTFTLTAQLFPGVAELSNPSGRLRTGNVLRLFLCGQVARTSAAPPPQAGTHNCPYICYKVASRKTRGLIHKGVKRGFRCLQGFFEVGGGGWRLRGRAWADVSLMNSPQNYAKRYVNDICISNWWKKTVWSSEFFAFK